MAHTKRINEAHEGGAGRERENQSECTNWLLLLLQGRAAAAEEEESRVGVEGTGYGYACRTHATGYTHAHTHTDRHTHAGCRKTLGKVNLLIWSKKSHTEQGQGKLLPVGNMLQVRRGSDSWTAAGCAAFGVTVQLEQCAIVGNRELFYCYCCGASRHSHCYCNKLFEAYKIRGKLGQEPKSYGLKKAVKLMCRIFLFLA